MENLSEEELRIMLAIAGSENSECDFDTLVQTVDLPATKAEYYVSLLSFEREYLLWLSSTDPNQPDCYRLTNKGREFLIEGSYI